MYLKSEYKTETSSGEQIIYRAFYNKTEGMKDFIETFDQRFSEETIGDRWELFRLIHLATTPNNHSAQLDQLHLL